MAFSFDGFDGLSYYLNELPSNLDNFDNYVILKFVTGTKSVISLRLIPFNNSFEFIPGDTKSTFKFDGSDSSSFIYKCGSVGGSFESRVWELSSENITVFDNSSFKGIVYCSDNLLSYSDILYNSEPFYWDSSMLSAPLVLQPVVKDIDDKVNIYESAYNEVFSILPVLFIVLIGFISIRKGINWLFSFFKKS